MSKDPSTTCHLLLHLNIFLRHFKRTKIIVLLLIVIVVLFTHITHYPPSKTITTTVCFNLFLSYGAQIDKTVGTIREKQMDDQICFRRGQKILGFLFSVAVYPYHTFISIKVCPPPLQQLPANTSLKENLLTDKKFFMPVKSCEELALHN